MGTKIEKLLPKPAEVNKDEEKKAE